MRPLLLLLLALALGAARARAGQDLAPYAVARPASQPVTGSTLLENDRFWPALVTLREPFRSFAAISELAAGLSGVLVRVETEALARVDFGSDGVLDVPVAKTDLVEAANAIRRGELAKTAPNFALMIGPRLSDARAERPRGFPFHEAAEQRGFLGVFADPASSQFEAIARALAPLADHPRVLTVLFPQGRHPDARVFAQLRELGWGAAFVLAHLSEPYTRVLLREGQAPPFVTLQTADGRIQLAAGWRADAAPAIRDALEREYPARAASSGR
jgi:hypothetical protein